MVEEPEGDEKFRSEPPLRRPVLLPPVPSEVNGCSSIIFFSDVLLGP